MYSKKKKEAQEKSQARVFQLPRTHQFKSIADVYQRTSDFFEANDRTTQFKNNEDEFRPPSDHHQIDSVAATVFHRNAKLPKYTVKPHREVKIIEPREGNQIKGYKVTTQETTTQENSNQANGITIASQKGNAYSEALSKKTEKEQKDEFNALYPLAPDQRRKRIDANETHNQYRPNPDTIKTAIKDGVFTLSYDYFAQKNGTTPPSFKATVSMNKGQLMSHVITGFGLSLKERASRGTNTATGTNQESTNRSHLIGDWFRGSAYKNALNIINASAKYNTGPMKIAERNITKEIEEIKEDYPEKRITFDMTVDAKYYLLARADILTTLETHLRKGEKSEVYKLLRDNEAPRKTIMIDYSAKHFRADGKLIAGKANIKIGKDKWI